MDEMLFRALGAGSGWAVVAVGVIWLLRGGIIPGSTHREILADRDRRIEKQEALIANLSEQNRVLLNSAIPTVNSVLTALHQAAAEGDRT